MRVNGSAQDLADAIMAADKDVLNVSIGEGSSLDRRPLGFFESVRHFFTGHQRPKPPSPEHAGCVTITIYGGSVDTAKATAQEHRSVGTLIFVIEGVLSVGRHGGGFSGYTRIPATMRPRP